MPDGHSSNGLSGTKKFSVEEAGCVAAVVGPAVLRNHRDHLGVAQQHLAHLCDRRHCRFKRDGGRHRRPDPQIAFLQCGQEFGSELWNQEPRQAQERDAEANAGLAMGERPMQRRRIAGAQGAHNDGLDLLEVPGKKQRRKHRRDCEGGKQRPRKRESVGPRHRIENLTFDALHGE